MASKTRLAALAAVVALVGGSSRSIKGTIPEHFDKDLTDFIRVYPDSKLCFDTRPVGSAPETMVQVGCVPAANGLWKSDPLVVKLGGGSHWLQVVLWTSLPPGAQQAAQSPPIQLHVAPEAVAAEPASSASHVSFPVLVDGVTQDQVVLDAQRSGKFSKAFCISHSIPDLEGCRAHLVREVSGPSRLPLPPAICP